MMKPMENLSGVKSAIRDFYEKEVWVKVDLGRNRTVEYCGRLTGIYSALFTVSPLDDFRGKTTYSYSEVLCKRVSVRPAE